MLAKASGDDYKGRFREIVSDPLNLLICRHILAGVVEDGYVYLHNGNKVPCFGVKAYYENFSDILQINRGVHEPLEEFVFQTVLSQLPETPFMLELGAYWGHYSMWLKKVRPLSSVCLVEPDASNIIVGKENFKTNGLEGEFIQDFVGRGFFNVDDFLDKKKLPVLDILHVDIQGYELEMLEGAERSLLAGRIKYCFVSTHSEDIHNKAVEAFTHSGYRIEVSSGFNNETTSYDGFIMASHQKNVLPVFQNFHPLGRVSIANSRPSDLLLYLLGCALSNAVATPPS
jgi:hypothetical protein